MSIHHHSLKVILSQNSFRQNSANHKNFSPGNLKLRIIILRRGATIHDLGVYIDICIAAFVSRHSDLLYNTVKCKLADF